MRVSALVFSFALVLQISSSLMAQSFETTQKGYSRVRTAFAEREATVKKLLEDKKISATSFDLFLRAFKQESQLELWAKNKTDNSFVLIKTYAVCRKSGSVGPKRAEGDYQVPEGFYYINHFNPTSTFFLSLKVSYPNESDAILGKKGKLGGDIYIHGDCVSIGCLPLEDEIKELYVFCVKAKSAGQSKIPIHMFPFKLSDENLLLMKKFCDSVDKEEGDSIFAGYYQFWQQLKPFYDYFEKHKKVPLYKVDAKGNYILNSN